MKNKITEQSIKNAKSAMTGFGIKEQKFKLITKSKIYANS